MNILLLGSGGREHAFAWKIKQSPLCKQLFIAPGNAGTLNCGQNVNIGVNDFSAIKDFCLSNAINMVVVGPEDPLVNGIYDFFMNDDQIKHIPVIGPSKEGAQLEGSKAYSKAFMMRHNVPTAAYAEFTADQLEEGYKFLETLKAPYVLKADGLAAGKGVLILDSIDEAKAELKEMLLEAKFGAASAKVVIEEFMKGIELSVFVLTDGKSYVILPEAKDYKRIGDGDTGLNTGGMGAVSPVIFANQEFLDKVEERIVKPTINGLNKENIPYKGFVFIGLMNIDGEPKVIEYNCRMGDPETEVVLPRVKNDLLELFNAVANQELANHKIEVDPRYATTIMMVSGGYPGDYAKGKVISGLDSINTQTVFHAGTAVKDGQIVSNGGRVIAFTSLGDTIQACLEESYGKLAKIEMEGANYRKDIGQDILALMPKLGLSGL